MKTDASDTQPAVPAESNTSPVADLETYAARALTYGRTYDLAALQYLRESFWTEVRSSGSPDEKLKTFKAVLDARRIALAELRQGDPDARRDLTLEEEEQAARELVDPLLGPVD